MWWTESVRDKDNFVDATYLQIVNIINLICIVYSAEIIWQQLYNQGILNKVFVIKCA